MRTTVTLDPDTEQLVRERMRTRGVSFKKALNDAIREGARATAQRRYTMAPRDLGPPAVDLTKALRLAGELEDQETIRRMQRGE